MQPLNLMLAVFLFFRLDFESEKSDTPSSPSSICEMTLRGIV